MNVIRALKPVAGYLWRLPLCAFAYVGGAMAGGALISALGLPLPEVPEQADGRIMGLCLFIGSLALAAGLAPLAKRIQGPCWARWLILAALCYVCLGVTVPLEGAIFTTLDGMASIPVFSIPPCLLFAAVTVLLFKPASRGDSFAATARRFFAGRSVRGWAGRLALAVCAFPVIYWTFGMMVAPFVMEYYKQGQFALATPHPGVIVSMQFLRSVLFLVVAMPILVAWSGSRRHLVLALGLAFYVLVGLFDLIQTYWLAPTLLVLHNVEILVDSLVYALALTWLLAPRDEAKADEPLAPRLLCVRQAPTVN